jgi:spore coat protein U-like protein
MKYTSVLNSAVRATLLGFLALGLTTTSAFAATGTTTFSVTAGVGNTCSVSATSLNFYTIVTTVANSATSTITVNCSANDVYQVGLGAGNGTEIARYMKGTITPANHLTYTLTSGSGAGPNWGFTTGGQVAGLGNAANQTLTVYGTIPVQASPGVDNYTDTITVTLTY